MHSKEQAQTYTKKYGVPTSCLFKSGMFLNDFSEKPVGSPIKIVYAGRLYCNRWKTLAALGDVLKEINKDEIKIVLDVYTQEALNKKQKHALCKDKYIYMKGAVSPQELERIYYEADIALHVESFDKKYRYATRYSFSTKIIDLMTSTCAIMAVCWEKQTGFIYLKEKNVAFCISSYSDLFPVLHKILDDPKLIGVYARKAWNCGKQYHQREVVQTYLRDIFQQVINYSKRSAL